MAGCFGAADDGNRFWSKSLALAPWATARIVLAWRAQLIEAGWNPGAVTKIKRIADIAAATASSKDLPHGAADRLAQLNRALESRVAQSIRRIRLIDRHADLPAAWSTLLDRLAAQGVAMEAIVPKVAQHLIRSGLVLFRGPPAPWHSTPGMAAALKTRRVADVSCRRPISAPALLARTRLVLARLF
jgi:hypothetical protein